MFMWQSVKRNVSGWDHWVVIRTIRWIRLTDSQLPCCRCGVCWLTCCVLCLGSCCFSCLVTYLWNYAQDIVFSEGSHVSNEPRTGTPRREQTALHLWTWTVSPVVNVVACLFLQKVNRSVLIMWFLCVIRTWSGLPRVHLWPALFQK